MKRLTPSERKKINAYKPLVRVVKRFMDAQRIMWNDPACDFGTIMKVDTEAQRLLARLGEFDGEVRKAEPKVRRVSIYQAAKGL